MDMKESVSPAASSPASQDVAMDDVAQSSGNSGDDEAPSNQVEAVNEEEEAKAEGTTKGSAAKFKASQDLRIQTANLPPTSKTKPRAHSVGSVGSVGEEDIGAEGGKTPVPVPCSTGKKRRRRTASQIDRKYPCTYPGCTKAYGSEGSLTQHQRLKHRNQSPEPGVQAAQLNSFFLPLHRTPRGLPGAIGRPTGTSGARTVTIRPAGIDGLTLHNFDVAAAAAAASLVPENDTITNDFSSMLPSPPHSLGSARQQLRARSNSMPISFSTSSLPYAGPPPPLSVPGTGTPGALATPSSLSTSSASSTGESTPSGAKVKAARRSRQASTPRSGGKPPLRRNKSRSKSESLQDAMVPFVLQEGIRPPSMDRSVSEDTLRGFPMGPATTGSMGSPAFDWRIAIAHSQHSDSPVSSVEEAIDSDILSVLADYDTSDTGDSTLELVGSTSFEDATESSYASSSGGRFPEPEDEWLSQQDAQYLTTHLEKMSMIHDSPPGSIAAHVIVAENEPMDGIKLEFPTTLDAVGAESSGSDELKRAFSGVAIDSFAVNSLDPPFVAGEDMKDGLKLHGSGLNDPSTELLDRDLFASANSSDFKQEPMATVPSQPTWTKELAALEPYSSSGIDQADYMDVDSTSFGPLQWKSADKLRSQTSQALYAGSFDSLTAYLQHGDKHGMYPTLGDAFALDSVDYAMEEPRLSSPVICQQKDL